MNVSSFFREVKKIQKESKEVGIPIDTFKMDKIIEALDQALCTLEIIIDDTHCTCDQLIDQGKICPHCLAIDIIETIDRENLS